MAEKVEGSVAGLGVEMARQAAEAERKRRTSSLVKFVPLGLAMVLFAFTQGLPPTEEETRRGAEATLGQNIGMVCFLVGFVVVVMALLTHLPYATRVTPALAEPLGEGEVRVYSGGKVTRASITLPDRRWVRGVVSGIRYRGWRPTPDGDPAQLFGTPKKGGFVVAVVWLPDGSMRVIGVRAIREA